MPRTIPWTTVDELAAILEGERDALTRQIAALLHNRDPNDQTARLEILLCRYLLDGSAKKATIWATAMGWRLDSLNHGKPSTRNWQPDDLYEAIRNEQTGLAADLANLCSRVYRIEQEKLAVRQ